MEQPQEQQTSAPTRILACRFHSQGHRPQIIWEAKSNELIIGEDLHRHRATLETSTLGEFMDDYGLSFEDIGEQLSEDVKTWHYASGDKKSWILFV